MSDQREDAAYERIENQRKAIEDTGTAEPEDSDDFFAKHAVPMIKDIYLLNGDICQQQQRKKHRDE